MNKNESPALSVALIICRLIAGGALLVAAYGKIINPKKLMLSMESFELLPAFLIPISSYILPWTELIVGLLLVAGFATRASAIWSTILYSIFTVAIISVIARGMEVDCGCFGALLGGGSVGIQSIARNLVFLIASGVVLWKGAGLFSVDAQFGGVKSAQTSEDPESTPESLDSSQQTT